MVKNISFIGYITPNKTMMTELYHKACRKSIADISDFGSGRYNVPVRATGERSGPFFGTFASSLIRFFGHLRCRRRSRARSPKYVASTRCGEIGLAYGVRGCPRMSHAPAALQQIRQYGPLIAVVRIEGQVVPLPRVCVEVIEFELP